MSSTLQAVLVVSLAFQNAGSGLLMRYVRSTPEESQFDTEMAVISQEIVKIVVCSALIILTGEQTILGFVRSFHWNEILKTFLP